MPESSVATRSRLLPAEAWVLGWLFLADQLLYLADRGPKVSDNDFAVVVSVLLGALVAGWFSAGVLRARMIRLALVWIVLVLALVSYAALCLDGRASGWTLVHLLMTGLQVLALWRFCRTAYFRQQRVDPRAGASLGGVLGLAILVGVLGGVTASAGDDEPGFRFEVRF